MTYAAYEACYDLVKDFYGDQRAKRSHLPLMNHIEEGLAILRHIGAYGWTQAAWCLHPLVQKDKDLLDSWSVLSNMRLGSALTLALEYRNQANAWLSDKVEYRRGVLQVQGAPTPGPLFEVKQMLIADKVQNYKDFLAYHQQTHERAKQLERYFQTWLLVLGIDGAVFNQLSAVAQGAAA